jgi:hypothetical protein
MKLDTSTVKRAARLLVVAAAAALGAGGALAEKPPWVGGHDKGRAEGPPGQMKKQRADGPSGQMRHQDERQDRWQSDDRHGRPGAAARTRHHLASFRQQASSHPEAEREEVQQKRSHDYQN